MMHAFPMWQVDQTKVLTRRELTAVLADQHAKARISANTRRNLIIVRLACCCGLRVSEIAGLQLDDVIVEGGRPHLRLRKETTKGKRPRKVPLWWDAGTLADLAAWKAERVGGGPGQGCLRLQCSGPPAWTTTPAARAPAAIPHRLQNSGPGAPADPDNPPRAAHLHLARLGRGAHAGRSAGRRGPQQRGRHQRLLAYHRRRHRAGG
jgi:hypothetical protein